jgi:O-succinylbenzoic acid--CoA ligase
MKVVNWLAASAAAVPSRVALVADGKRFTYAELEQLAATRARQFARLGVERGDRVALVLDPSGDYVVLLHALMKLGAVAVPLDHRLHKQELEVRLSEVEAALVVRDPLQVTDAGEADRALDRTLELDSVHCLIHTSGTGGRARPVTLTYSNHLWSAVGSAVRIGVDPEDRWLCCLALHHIGGLAIVLRSAIYGTAVAVERFDPDAISSLISQERVTIASLVGTTLARLMGAGAGLDRMRCVLLGGGPPAPGLIEQALDAEVPIAPTYGLTEAASQVTTLAPGEARRRPGSAGTPILPAEVRVEDDLIQVRGPNVARDQLGADGWLRTRDRGYLDPDGHLHVRGRADDLIVTGGENVSPEEVEQTLCLHPAVADAAVAGREDPEWQRAVVAAVVLRDGARASEAELRAFCRQRLAGYKVPKRISFTATLPRDAQGKLRRRAIGGSPPG